MSNWIRHDECPKCGSKNNLAVYDDHAFCFGMNCGYYINYDNNNNKENVVKDMSEKTTTMKYGLPNKPMPGSEERSICAEAVNKYQVSISINPDTDIEAVFPRCTPKGDHVANQLRFKDKKFLSEGNLEGVGLFGQHLFPAGGKSITVTEGYYDTLASFELTGCRYPTVGVQSSGSAKKEIVENFEYLNSFEKVVFNFDNDKPGQEAAELCASLFDAGKVRILKLSEFKDANDYLKNGLNKKYVQEWYAAAPFVQQGILLGSDPSLLNDVIYYVEPKSVPYPWEGMNEKTYGVRTSELVLLTADTGVGKTSVCKEIEYSLLMNEELVKDKVGVGFLHLEEPKRDLALGLMSIHKDKPYHFPDVDRTEAELIQAYKEVIDTDRVVIWDHFGSNDIDVVLGKIRHMSALGCKYIFLDHLSIVVSDQSGDERKQLDEISTKIKTLTMNLDIAVFCVIHINRQGGVRGSAGPEQVANIVVRLERDKKELDPWRRNVTRIMVEKNRKFGRTGPACYLYYNEDTGRLVELSPELSKAYETGQSAAGNEFELIDSQAA